MNKVEFAKSTNSYITDYIKFADVKASVLLTVSGLLAGGLGKLSLSLFGLLKGRDNFWCLAVIAIVIMLWVSVSFLGALWMSFKALKPSFDKADSLHSFPDIAKRSCEDYTQASLGLSSEGMISNFCAHNWTLSHIANAKFKALQCAIYWLYSSISAAFALGILYILLYLTAKG